MIGGIGGLLKAFKTTNEGFCKGNVMLKCFSRPPLSLSFPVVSFQTAFNKMIGTPNKTLNKACKTT